MKILSRKFTAIVLLAVMSISAFAIGVLALGYKPAVAEPAQTQIVLPDNIVSKNIEDCIYDITADTVNGGIQYANSLEYGSADSIQSEDIIITNAKGQDKINVIKNYTKEKTWQFGVFTKKGADCVPEKNANKYDGNLYFWNQKTSQAKFARNQLLFYTNGMSNTLVSFRMLYRAGYEYSFYEDVPNIGSWNNYHKFTINTNGSVELSGDKTTVKSYSASELLTSLQAVETDATALYETGDMLLVTVGSYHTGTEKTHYYFKVVNETKGYTVFELLEEGAYAADKAGSFVIFWQGTNAENALFNLCGVNKPLFANYNYKVEEELTADNIGKSVTTVELNDNYSHIDATEQVLKVGENKIKVNYNQGEYFGSTELVSATVTVNVKANTVVLKDMAGEELSTQYVGDSIELPTFEREKTFIAYKASNGKLYKQGETVTLIGDETFTLIEAEVEILDKVDIRLSEDENGGLRFGIQILTEDFVALQQAQVGFAVKIAGETIELVPSATSGDYSIAYFAKTDISAEYFNTDITAEIVIAYESGSATIASANANLYELASDLVLQNEIAIMDGQALFNQAAAELIEKYLNVANA